MVCNYIDDDCDVATGKGTFEAKCFRTPECTGVLNCSSFAAGSCPSGCVVEELYGRCENVGNYCTSDADCTGTLSCIGYGGQVCAEGFDSCTKFSYSLGTCNTLGTCGEACWDDSSMEGCESIPDPTGGMCQFTCENLNPVPNYEVCDDGIDNEPDGLIDCQDPDCQVGVGVTLTPAEMLDYNCLGTPQDGFSVMSWHCTPSIDDESVGLCCQDGARPRLDPFNNWYCSNNAPCDPNVPASTCGHHYNTSFNSWIGSVGTSGDADWCVSPTEGRACCAVVTFGTFEYWDDEITENVIVY